MLSFWRGLIWGAVGAAGLGAVGLGLMGPSIARSMTGGAVRRLLKDGKYSENLGEMLATGVGRHPRVLLETALRAERGQKISRPFYTSKRFLHFDDLMFIPAQLAKMPTGENETIDLNTVIGPKAQRPLKLALPVLISGMSYGLSLTGACKIALARGASAVGTATNSGEGGLYPEERAHARHYILQYTRGGWPSDPEVLRQADAIEIQVGQGAQAGSPQSTPGWKLTAEYRAALGLREGEDALIHSRFPGVNSPEEFSAMVARIRAQVDGIPVGVKLAAGQLLEEDIRIALAAGADFITVDGAQASSHASQPILLDDFGIPSIMAVVRAARVLKGTGVTLIASGGFMTPGEMLKALALGADAIAVGAAPVMAAVGAQYAKIAPLEPPTALVLHDGKHRDRFDVEIGARNVEYWFRAVVDEIVTGVRSVGRTGVHQVDRSDLCALTREVAEVTGVQPAWLPPAAEGVDHGLPGRSAAGRERTADKEHETGNPQPVH